MKKKVCMVVPSFTAKGGITSVVNGYRNSQLTEDYDVRFIETYCDKDNVEFPGWIRNEQKRQYLREADIFLLPSYNEGMPMAILDAMGCGLPIVSTDVGGIPKIVRQGINGYLYKPGDSKSMACAIIEYLTDDEKRLKAGQESVDIIRESYSLQQNIDKLERVYTEVERLRDDKL